MKVTIVLAAIVCLIATLVTSAPLQPGARVSARLPPGYYAYNFATNLSRPRHMAAFPNGDVIVINDQTEELVLLFDDDGDGVSNATERFVLTPVPHLVKKQIIFYEGYLYSHNITNYWRWPYTPGSRQKLINPPELILYGMPALPSVYPNNRGIFFDPEGRLYVAISNGTELIPENSNFSRIMRYQNVTQIVANGGIYWEDGETFASGLRETVGLAVNRYGDIWGSDNGIAILTRPDLGGNLIDTNPGDEINYFGNYQDAGAPGPAFYGFPYCWSQYILPLNVSKGMGANFVDPHFQGEGSIYTDEYCNDNANVVKPVMQFFPHHAPIDWQFYEPSDVISATAFPGMQDNAFIASRGPGRSGNLGRLIEMVQFSAGHFPVNILPFYSNPADVGTNTTLWEYTPGGLVFGRCAGRECLLVSSDSTNDVVAIVYNGTASPTPSSSPAASSSPSVSLTSAPSTTSTAAPSTTSTAVPSTSSSVSVSRAPSKTPTISVTPTISTTRSITPSRSATISRSPSRSRRV